MLVKDLVPGVIKKLRNRDDIADDIPDYIMKAVLDLTQSYEFEELRKFGPIVNFVQGQSVYPKEGNGCIFIYPDDVKITFIVSWFCYFSTDLTSVSAGGNTFTQNSSTSNVNTGLEMKSRAVRVVQPMSVIPGQPTCYVIVANSIMVGFNPSTNFVTQMLYQRQHPKPRAGSSVAVQNQQEIYMPDDWQDIIEYAAAEKACDNVGMNDVGIMYHQKIYGNPQRKYPGLIAERQSQQQRNVAFNERQFRPTVRRYTR